MTTNKTNINYIFVYLTELQRYDIIELMAKSDKKEIAVIKIKKRLVPDLIIHNAIIKYLENNNVECIREDIIRDGI